MNISSEILKYCNKWNQLGIKTFICKVDKIFGIKKLHKNSIEFNHEIKQLPDEYNFLGVKLGESGLMCLDIEGTNGSVNEFSRIIEREGLKMSDLFMEKTLNHGLHVYFRFDKKIKNQYGLKYGDMNFDLLFSGKSFSAPSRFENKNYTFINKSIFDLRSLNDIPEFPKELVFLLQNENI